jgi:hypothetical protein
VTAAPATVVLKEITAGLRTASCSSRTCSRSHGQ